MRTKNGIDLLHSLVHRPLQIHPSVHYPANRKGTYLYNDRRGRCGCGNVCMCIGQEDGTGGAEQ